MVGDRKISDADMPRGKKSEQTCCKPKKFRRRGAENLSKTEKSWHGRGKKMAVGRGRADDEHPDARDEGNTDDNGHHAREKPEQKVRGTDQPIITAEEYDEAGVLIGTMKKQICEGDSTRKDVSKEKHRSRDGGQSCRTRPKTQTCGKTQRLSPTTKKKCRASLPVEKDNARQ